MAKYNYKFACGHGTGEVSLSGKHAERERKLAWYASNYTCAACYKAAQEQADAIAPKVASLLTREGDAHVRLAIQVTGQLSANMPVLRQLGFYWADEAGGMAAYLSMVEPKKALQINVRVDSIEQADAWLKEWQLKLAALGYELADEISQFDKALMLDKFKRLAGEAFKKNSAAANELATAQAVAAQQAKNLANAKAKDPAPKAPKWWRELMAGYRANGLKTVRFNGAFYGTGKTRAIYLNNDKITCSEQDMLDYKSWLAAKKEWLDFWDLKQ